MLMLLVIAFLTGTLGTLLGSAVQASAVSFLIAVPVAACFCLANGTIGKARGAFGGALPWWGWLAGICGAISVLANAQLIPLIGAGAFFTAMLLGQLLLSLVMEARGWLGAPQKFIAPAQYAGLALMLAGVALIRL